MYLKLINLGNYSTILQKLNQFNCKLHEGVLTATGTLVDLQTFGLGELFDRKLCNLKLFINYQTTAEQLV